MIAYKYAALSLLASITCIIGKLIFNYDLARDFLSSGGKTRALFGLTELRRLEIKLYFIPLAIMSAGFSIIACRTKEIKWLTTISIIGSIMAIISFFRIWRLMI